MCVSNVSNVSETWLNDVWSVYFHDPEDNSWTLDSYKRLGDVASVEDLRSIVEATGPVAHSGMFFAMREHVFPCWDDVNNIDGGCLSIKVPMESAREVWEEILKRAVGETLVIRADKWNSLNGVSISPKRGFSIVKFWMSDADGWDGVDAPDHLRIPAWYKGQTVFRLNRENMQMDAVKVSVRSGASKSNDD